MRVEASRLSEQPVLPSFPTVTSLPSKDKERPPHLSGDAEGKGPPMKKRKRFSLAWLALLALAGVMSWISGPSRGLLWTARDGALPCFLQKTNKNGVQLNIMIIQGGRKSGV